MRGSGNMSLQRFVQKQKTALVCGVFFCAYGQDRENLRQTKLQNPNAIFYEFAYQKGLEYDPLTPTYEITVCIKNNAILGAEKYKAYVLSSPHKIREVKEIAAIAKKQPVFLVGFYNDPTRDFRQALSELIEECGGK
jgi:hypothetical protein